jgi:multimeric flavodoxin WrbA
MARRLTFVGVSGSPRSGGNTETLVKRVLGGLAAEGIDTELVSLAGKRIEPCRACRTCYKTKECVIADDVSPIFDKLAAADGFVLAAPVYFSGTAGQMKCLIDRIGYLSGARGRVFQRKVGAPLTVARRAGHNFALAEMMFLFMHQGMIVPGSTYWNMAFGQAPGDVAGDAEGMRTADNLAQSLAWTLRKVTAADQT